jgi:hypothetical protein
MEPCEGCGYDGKGDKRNLYKHKKNCPKRALVAMHSENAELRSQLSQHVAMDSDLRIQLGQMMTRILSMEAQQKRMEAHQQRMEAQMQSLVPAQTTVNNFNIVVYAFGKEPDPPKDKVWKLLDAPVDSVPKYIEARYFSKPETRSIRWPNLRDSTVIVQVEGPSGLQKEEHRDRKRFCSDLADRAIEHLIERYDADTHARWNDWYKRAKLDQEGYDKTPAFKEMEKSVELLLKNNR